MASLALRDDDFAWITAEVAALGVPTVSVLEGGYNPNPNPNPDPNPDPNPNPIPIPDPNPNPNPYTRCSRAAITWACSLGACAATWTHSSTGMAMGDADWAGGVFGGRLVLFYRDYLRVYFALAK